MKRNFRSVFSALAIFAGFNVCAAAAHASNASLAKTPRLSPCKTMMTCGEYEGTGSQWFKVDNKDIGTNDIIETASISESGPNSLHFVVDYRRAQRPADSAFVVDLQLVFSADGRFTAKAKGALYAVGICRFQSCTFEFVPYKKENQGANMNSLIFQDGVMIHQMLATAISPESHSSSTLFVELKKKP